MQQQDGSGAGGSLDERTLGNATAENEEAHTPRESADGPGDDPGFSNEHPLASPGELAGTADQAIAAEIAALGPDNGSLADAAGSATGADLEDEDLSGSDGPA
ncbi:hypothetical protein ACFQPG_11175 [Sphingomonas sp. GCM10030256]|uniref:hypothetical protein n=1 Tax=Sphingomonas sp. GCM10030256 TaxID=3273427 RepID=UPI00360A8B9C